MITSACKRDLHDDCEGELDPKHKKGRWCGCACHADDRTDSEARAINDRLEREESLRYLLDEDDWDED